MFYLIVLVTRGFQENSDKIQIHTDCRTHKVLPLHIFFKIFWLRFINLIISCMWNTNGVNLFVKIMQIEDLKNCTFAEVNSHKLCIFHALCYIPEFFYFAWLLFFFFNSPLKCSLKLVYDDLDMLVPHRLLGAIPNKWTSGCHWWIKSWPLKTSGMKIFFSLISLISIV